MENEERITLEKAIAYVMQLTSLKICLLIFIFVFELHLFLTVIEITEFLIKI